MCQKLIAVLCLIASVARDPWDALQLREPTHARLLKVSLNALCVRVVMHTSHNKMNIGEAKNTQQAKG